jgi:hypothetical protein
LSFLVKERTAQPLALAAQRAGRTLGKPHLFLTHSTTLSTILASRSRTADSLPTPRASSAPSCAASPSSHRSEAEGRVLRWETCRPGSNRRTGPARPARLTPPAMPNGSSGLPGSTTSFHRRPPTNACLFRHLHRLGRLQGGGTAPPYGRIRGQVCPAALSGVKR